MTEEQEQIFRNRLNEQFRKVRAVAMAASAKAMATVILEKITDFEKDHGNINDLDGATIATLVSDIKQFCEVGIGTPTTKEEKEEQAHFNAEENRQLQDIISRLPQNVQDVLNKRMETKEEVEDGRAKVEEDKHTENE